MNIAPVLNIEREKMGCLKILLKINDGVYVFICTVHSNFLKQHTQHAFFYDIYFQQKKRVRAVVQSLTIEDMHPSVYWRKKIEKPKIH